MSNWISDVVFLLLVFLLIILFAGKPDLHDALVHRLMECPR
jgi:hypothetical protein